ICPIAIARYRLTRPTSPTRPATPPHIASRADSRLSARPRARQTRSISPPICDSRVTVMTGVRRVARPPLKSPTPHVAPEASPKTTAESSDPFPMRLASELDHGRSGLAGLEIGIERIPQRVAQQVDGHDGQE